jgi:hypothetical protein
MDGENQKIRELFELFRVSHESWNGLTDPVRMRTRTASA